MLFSSLHFDVGFIAILIVREYVREMRIFSTNTRALVYKQLHLLSFLYVRIFVHKFCQKGSNRWIPLKDLSLDERAGA